MSLQDRLKKNREKLESESHGYSGKIRDKFKKRDTSVLEKTYDKKDEKTKAGGMGKSIFIPEMLEQYGMEEWYPHQTVGDHFFNIMPVSFNPQIPYCFECMVHGGVGFAKDNFICPHHANRRPCYRCETQSKLYRKKEDLLQNISEERFKRMVSQLYPRDRVVFLIWKRTEELLQEESPDLTLRLWNAPKEAVHKEIQTKVRDKINRTTLDVSDITPNGEGRVIGFEVSKRKTEKGTFPGYGGFELHVPDNPIPDEILEQLNQVITDAEENGFKNSIEMFIHHADYEEIKESMQTEEEDDDEEETEGKSAKPSLKQQLKSKDEAKDEEKLGLSKVDDTLADIELECSKLNDELNAKSSIAFKAWCKNNNYAEALEFNSQPEAVDAIVEDMYEKLLAEADIDI